MSTTNTSLVKWVSDGNLFDEKDKVANYSCLFGVVPVTPLADLTELVEGLKQATEACTTADSAYSVGYRDGRMDVLTVLLTQLEEHRGEGENDEG